MIRCEKCGTEFTNWLGMRRKCPHCGEPIKKDEPPAVSKTYREDDEPPPYDPTTQYYDEPFRHVDPPPSSCDTSSSYDSGSSSSFDGGSCDGGSCGGSE